jgi:hypothetical protein
MFATAHLDLVRAAVAERMAVASRPTGSTPTPITPARVTTWGPRSSRRPTAAPAEADVVLRLPAPRPAAAVLIHDVVLLDA